MMASWLLAETSGKIIVFSNGYLLVVGSHKKKIRINGGKFYFELSIVGKLQNDGYFDFYKESEKLPLDFFIGNSMEKYHNDFDNTATIAEKMILPYKDAHKKQKSFVLTISADYDNDFVYFVSVYETKEKALEKLSVFSCGTFKLEK